jgi:hypothetical protein
MTLATSGAKALATAPAIAGLRALKLTFTRIGGAGLEALARARHLRALESLEIVSSGITADSVVVLARSPVCTTLKELILSLCVGTNNFGDDGIRLIAASASVQKLEELHLAGVPLGRAGLNALLRSRYLGGLKHLSLSLPHSDEGETKIKVFRTALEKHFGPVVELFDGG